VALGLDSSLVFASRRDVRRPRQARARYCALRFGGRMRRRSRSVIG